MFIRTRSLCQASFGQPCGGSLNGVLVFELDDETGVRGQFGQFSKEPGPGKISVPDGPMPVRKMVSVLQVHMGEHVARSADKSVYSRCLTDAMGPGRMARVDGDLDCRVVKMLGQLDPSIWVAILNILKHQFKAQRGRTGHRGANRCLHPVNGEVQRS